MPRARELLLLAGKLLLARMELLLRKPVEAVEEQAAALTLQLSLALLLLNTNIPVSNL